MRKKKQTNNQSRSINDFSISTDTGYEVLYVIIICVIDIYICVNLSIVTQM